MKMNGAQDYKQREETILERPAGKLPSGWCFLWHCAHLQQPNALASLSSFPSLEEATFSLEVREVLEIPVSLEGAQSKQPL